MRKAAARDGVDRLFEAITEGLAKGENMRIVGFGTFGTRKLPTRTGRNPRTRESLSITVSTVPVFKPGKGFRDYVDEVNRE